MRYCTQCILPDTRPNLNFNVDGVCDACTGHTRRKAELDWEAQAAKFAQVVANARQPGAGYDCLIPVSGGKDSTWQVVKCLEYGLKPLAVTWKTPGRTPLGQANLDNLVRLGVDHIDYQVSPDVERKFMYRTLVEKGSTAVPMHLALFNIPLTIAVRFGIKLVVWGENSAQEYGGDVDESRGHRLTGEWLRKWGVTHGTSAADWVSAELTEKELTPYFGPTEEELEAAGVLAVFLGSYFRWDPETSLEVARAHGFRVDEEGPRTGYYNYADVDDDFISLHHYLKWYKFGFTRTWDNLSLEIRNQRMTRDAAIDVLRKRGDETPVGDIEKFCAFARITVPHFFEVIEKFRNPAVWSHEDGRWTIPGFLLPEWRWS